jgi:hypothetical protein
MAGNRRWSDAALGADRPIERRDFLDGLAGMGAAAAQGGVSPAGTIPEGASQRDLAAGPAGEAHLEHGLPAA